MTKFDVEGYESENARVQGEITRANVARDFARGAERLAAFEAFRTDRPNGPAPERPTTGGSTIGRLIAGRAAEYAAAGDAAYRAAVADSRRQAEAQARRSGTQRPMTAGERAEDARARAIRAAAFDNDAA